MHSSRKQARRCSGPGAGSRALLVAPRGRADSLQSLKHVLFFIAMLMTLALTRMKNHFRLVEPFFPLRITSYDILYFFFFFYLRRYIKGGSAKRLRFVNNVCSGYV